MRRCVCQACDGSCRRNEAALKSRGTILPLTTTATSPYPIISRGRSCACRGSNMSGGTDPRAAPQNCGAVAHALAETGRVEDDRKLSQFHNGFYLQGDRSTNYAERAADCKLARLRAPGGTDAARAGHRAGKACYRTAASKRQSISAPCSTRSERSIANLRHSAKFRRPWHRLRRGSGCQLAADAATRQNLLD